MCVQVLCLAHSMVNRPVSAVFIKRKTEPRCMELVRSTVIIQYEKKGDHSLDTFIL